MFSTNQDKFSSLVEKWEHSEDRSIRSFGAESAISSVGARVED